MVLIIYKKIYEIRLGSFVLKPIFFFIFFLFFLHFPLSVGISLLFMTMHVPRLKREHYSGNGSMEKKKGKARNDAVGVIVAGSPS